MAEGNLSKQPAYRPAPKYLRNAMNEIRDGDDSAFDDLDGRSSSDEEAASADVLTPGSVTLSVEIIVNIKYCHLILGPLNARPSTKLAQNSCISLDGEFRTSLTLDGQEESGSSRFEDCRL